MIGEVLTIVAKEVSTYINKQMKVSSSKKCVILNKPNNINGKLDIPDNCISLSLLNIEEELSNRTTFVEKKVIDGKVYKQNPPININLYIMFISNFPKDYVSELNYSTKIIEFFQQKGSFTSENTKGLDDLKITKLNFKLNNFSITSESSDFWSLLNEKYGQSIIYKVSMITIQEDEKLSNTGIVKQVDINTNKI